MRKTYGVELTGSSMSRAGQGKGRSERSQNIATAPSRRSSWSMMGNAVELHQLPHAIAAAQQPASGVSGPPLLQRGAHGPTRVVRPGGGIIAQLAEPVGLLGADAPRLLEAHPEDPLGGLVVEDYRFRGVLQDPDVAFGLTRACSAPNEIAYLNSVSTIASCWGPDPRRPTGGARVPSPSAVGPRSHGAAAGGSDTLLASVTRSADAAPIGHEPRAEGREAHPRHHREVQGGAQRIPSTRR